MDESILHREDGPKMHPNVRWGKTRGTRSDGPTDKAILGVGWLEI